MVLDAAGGANFEHALNAFRADYERWETAARDHQPVAPPPQWPGQLLFGRVRLRDDIGSEYRLQAGQSGGVGQEFRCIHRFRPAPPGDARQLLVDVMDGQALVGSVTLDLATSAQMGTDAGH